MEVLVGCVCVCTGEWRESEREKCIPCNTSISSPTKKWEKRPSAHVIRDLMHIWWLVEYIFTHSRRLEWMAIDRRQSQGPTNTIDHMFSIRERGWGLWVHIYNFSAFKTKCITIYYYFDNSMLFHSFASHTWETNEFHNQRFVSLFSSQFGTHSRNLFECRIRSTSK